jgi:hypothetical protein
MVLRQLIQLKILSMMWVATVNTWLYILKSLR